MISVAGVHKLKLKQCGNESISQLTGNKSATRPTVVIDLSFESAFKAGCQTTNLVVSAYYNPDSKNSQNTSIEFSVIVI